MNINNILDLSVQAAQMAVTATASKNSSNPGAFALDMQKAMDSAATAVNMRAQQSKASDPKPADKLDAPEDKPETDAARTEKPEAKAEPKDDKTEAKADAAKPDKAEDAEKPDADEAEEAADAMQQFACIPQIQLNAQDEQQTAITDLAGGIPPMELDPTMMTPNLPIGEAAQELMANDAGLTPEQMQQLMDAAAVEGDVPQEAAQAQIIEGEAAVIAPAMPKIEQNDAAKQDVRLAGENSGEIGQAVVSNDAERTVMAAQGGQEAGTDADAELSAQSEELLQPARRNSDNNKIEQPVFDLNAARTGNAAQLAPDAVVELGDAEQVQAQQQVLFDNMLEQVQSAVTQQKSEMYIQLKPDVLGGLAIHLTMTEEGLSAQVRTTSESVQSVITSQIAQLEDSLRQRGINVVNMDVTYDLMAGSRQFDQQRRQFDDSGAAGGNRRYYTAQVSELSGSAYENAYESMMPVELGNGEGVVYSA